MRHFAEHLDDQIRHDSVVGGTSPLVVGVHVDRLDYAGETVSYVELASCIRRLEGLAHRLLAAPSVEE
jgi:hypothetical protein